MPVRRQITRQIVPQMKIKRSEVESASRPQPPDATAPPADSAIETTEYILP